MPVSCARKVFRKKLFCSQTIPKNRRMKGAFYMYAALGFYPAAIPVLTAVVMWFIISCVPHDSAAPSAAMVRIDSTVTGSVYVTKCYEEMHAESSGSSCICVCELDSVIRCTVFTESTFFDLSSAQSEDRTILSVTVRSDTLHAIRQEKIDTLWCDSSCLR